MPSHKRSSASVAERLIECAHAIAAKVAALFKPITLRSKAKGKKQQSFKVNLADFIRSITFTIGLSSVPTKDVKTEKATYKRRGKRWYSIFTFKSGGTLIVLEWDRCYNLFDFALTVIGSVIQAVATEYRNKQAAYRVVDWIVKPLAAKINFEWSEIPRSKVKHVIALRPKSADTKNLVDNVTKGIKSKFPTVPEIDEVRGALDKSEADKSRGGNNATVVVCKDDCCSHLPIKDRSHARLFDRTLERDNCALVQKVKQHSELKSEAKQATKADYEAAREKWEETARKTKKAIAAAMQKAEAAKTPKQKDKWWGKVADLTKQLTAL